MINALQLRLGNLVYNKDGNIIKFDMDEYVGKNTLGPQILIETVQFPPILLDEEWLLKFGFSKGKVEVVHEKTIKTNDHYEKGTSCVHPLPAGGYQFLSGTGSSSAINYVHELQNEYWSSTTQELTLNDPE